MNTLTGKPSVSGFRGWITKKAFQVYAPQVGNQITLNFSSQDLSLLLNALAHDILRFSRASAESIASISPVASLPRSRAWSIKQWYYAAYYAAHSTLLMFGCGLSYLEQGHANQVNQVAALYGQPSNLGAGYYEHSAEVAQQQVLLTRQNLQGGGSHDALWRKYREFLDHHATAVLAAPLLAPASAQVVSEQVELLRDVISSPPRPQGTWLSYIRNLVSYKHDLRVWFPYGRQTDHPTMVPDHPWEPSDPAHCAQNILAAQGEVERFHAACRTIVALCREMSYEMIERCPGGKSFLVAGIRELDRLFRQRAG